MSRFAVIDTETTWTDEVMSIGAVVADSRNYRIVDSRYYLIDPAFRRGGLFSDALHMRGTPKEQVASRRDMAADLRAWLCSHGVDSIFAYNAQFDRTHMPEFADFQWFDIMRVAAYRQFNPGIPDTVPCFKTGRMKRNYGVEPIYRMLSGNQGYCEKHNGWHDAVDELRIMEMLALPIEVYETARLTDN